MTFDLAAAALDAAKLPRLAGMLRAAQRDGRHLTGLARVGSALASATCADAEALRGAREAVRALADQWDAAFPPAFYGLA